MLRLRMLACGTMRSVTSMVLLRLAEYPSVVRLPPNASASSASLRTSPPIPSTTMLRLSALGLRRDPHGSVKQIHHEELENGDKERPSGFPKILLKQTDSGIQQLHGAGERAQDQQRRRRLLVDRPQYEQSQEILCFPI